MGVLAAALLCAAPRDASAFSVLAHRALIDAMWRDRITPVLVARFPGATLAELHRARSYAYGGAIIQDVGYYPGGRTLYSALTHYARSGDFVHALLAQSRTLNELAFAIGALSHYAGDLDGHTVATNRAVALLYPELRARFGDEVMYAHKQSAHVRTEFAFDVIQVARRHFAPQSYHERFGFRVATGLLERAFAETYAIELHSLFEDLDHTVLTYRWVVSTAIPHLTRVAWHRRRAEIRESDTLNVEYHMTRNGLESEWGTKLERPGIMARTLSVVLRILPKIGPLKLLAMKPSTPETETLFAAAFDSATATFGAALAALRADSLRLPNRNLDTGMPPVAGDYSLADEVHFDLLRKLAGERARNVPAPLRASLRAFYADTAVGARTGKAAKRWGETLVLLRRVTGPE
jgi:hypothetical protein